MSAEPGYTVLVEVESLGVRAEHALSEREALSIGRGEDCHVVLPSAAVSRKHASLLVRDGALLLRDHSSNGTWFEGRRLRMCTKTIDAHAELEIGSFRISVRLLQHGRQVASAPSTEPPLGEPSGCDRAPPRALVGVAQRLTMRRELLDNLDLVAMEREAMTPTSLRPRVREALERIASRMSPELPSGVDVQTLLEELCDEVLGLGPLEPLLADPEVSEIMVVDAETIYVERRGLIELSERVFTDDTAIRSVLERIVTPIGRRIDESNPIVDARLSDGSRVNAVIPPLAFKGPAITIRKFPKDRLSLRRLVELGTLSEAMALFLERCVRVRTNLVIAGGTGSGKTTLLNVLSAAIPERERIVTVEDAAELQLAQRHVVSLESRPANMEGAGAVTIRELVKNALRMRPDRIVVGECRGGEALDMLQAMNTGHDGSMTTTHANSPLEAVQRLETLCLMSGIDLPASAIRRQIASSVEVLVQQARFSDGTRRITHISEVVGLGEHGEVELRDVFRYQRRATDEHGGALGAFAPTGYVPRCVERFITYGLAEEGACL